MDTNYCGYGIQCMNDKPKILPNYYTEIVEGIGEKVNIIKIMNPIDVRNIGETWKEWYLRINVERYDESKSR